MIFPRMTCSCSYMPIATSIYWTIFTAWPIASQTQTFIVAFEPNDSTQIDKCVKDTIFLEWRIGSRLGHAKFICNLLLCVATLVERMSWSDCARVIWSVAVLPLLMVRGCSASSHGPWLFCLFSWSVSVLPLLMIRVCSARGCLDLVNLIN
jgi:hypothetical protein